MPYITHAPIPTFRNVTLDLHNNTYSCREAVTYIFNEKYSAPTSAMHWGAAATAATVAPPSSPVPISPAAPPPRPPPAHHSTSHDQSTLGQIWAAGGHDVK